MNQIQISNVAIRQISDTLYNLNDLHKAADGCSIGQIGLLCP